MSKYILLFILILLSACASKKKLFSEFRDATALSFEDFTVPEVARDPKLAAFTFTYTAMDCNGPLKFDRRNRIVDSCKGVFYLGSNETWVNPLVFIHYDSIRQAQLLNHESGHYRLSIIETKRYEKLFKGFTYDTTRLQIQIDSLRAVWKRDSDSLQVQYDNQTNHGHNLSEQGRWDTILIKRLIQSYKTPERLMKHKL